MLTWIAGLYTFAAGYQAFRNADVGLMRFRKPSIRLNAKQAKLVGLILSIWGEIFILIGCYITLFNQTSFNFAFGIWLYGYILINVVVVIMVMLSNRKSKIEDV